MGRSYGLSAQGVSVDVLKGDLQKSKRDKRNLPNNVFADTIVVHREEGAKEHCLFWGHE